MGKAPTTEQLRAGVGAPDTAGKAGMRDEAAAPMAADAEAGGAGPTPGEVAQAAAHELKPRAKSDLSRHASGPTETEPLGGRGGRPSAILLGVVIGLAAAAALAVGLLQAVV